MLPRAGARLQPVVLAGEDGSLAPAGWFDTQLGTDCEILRASDGERRCLPVGVDQNITDPMFSDAACAVPVIEQSDARFMRGTSGAIYEATEVTTTELFSHHTPTDDCRPAWAGGTLHVARLVPPSSFVRFAR